MGAKHRYHKGYICIRCNGEGKIYRNIDNKIVDKQHGIITQICGNCNGRGWATHQRDLVQEAVEEG